MHGIRNHLAPVSLATPFLCAALAAADAACPADADGSRSVDFGDVALILIDFGPCAGCTTDLDGTGSVDNGDVAMALLEFGPCASWYTVLEQTPDPAVVYDAQLRAAISATGLPWRVRDNGTSVEMVLIPPGSYQRGCTQSVQQGFCYSAELPAHQVTLSRPYYIGRYEVTQAQWTATMGSNPSQFKTASDEVPAAEVPNRPVEKVTFNGVKAFLAASGLRLPTEAEWEHAYRAGTATAFHGSAAMPGGTSDESEADPLGWSSDNCVAQTRPVGGKLGNGFGVHDMAGNVWEFVADWYGGYSSMPLTDPTGPATGTTCIVRGGGWDFGGPSFLRASYRSSGLTTSATSGTGFRVARNP
jgi:formylglycine-generating enzyme required for sulfatase activity